MKKTDTRETEDLIIVNYAKLFLEYIHVLGTELRVEMYKGVRLLLIILRHQQRSEISVRFDKV